MGHLRRDATTLELDDALDSLDRQPLKVRALDWPGELEGLGHPGLYSWWVDDAGADDLSAELGRVQPGRIYIGQAGEDSDATLAGRISGNHLDGRIARSTLRRSLAASLREILDLEVVGDAVLSRDSEDVLSGWMKRHLFVAVHATPDRSALYSLERRVHKALDPPLNLQGMASNAQRSKLSKLRGGLIADTSTKKQSASKLPSKPRQASNPDPVDPDADAPTLHAEIEAVLGAAGGPLSSSEIASRVNSRDRYDKRDGSPVKPSQISARIAKYSRFTRTADGRITLASTARTRDLS